MACCRIKVNVITPPIIAVSVIMPSVIGVDVGTPLVPYPAPEYSGAYEVTPSQETQILETAGLKMTDNVTVNPIPSNYGLITWNGAALTVS